MDHHWGYVKMEHGKEIDSYVFEAPERQARVTFTYSTEQTRIHYTYHIIWFSKLKSTLVFL